MNKKTMLLALGAVSAMMLAVPATSSATLEPLHMNPTPSKIDISGGPATLLSNAGDVTCAGVKGTATPEAGGTTGTMQLTFGPACWFNNNVSQPCTSTNPAEITENISTTVLPYHLVTIDNGTPVAPSPGVLITPAAGGAFAHFNCTILKFPVQLTVEGNGVLGTITVPPCGGKSKKAAMAFKAAGGTTTQQHRFTHNKNAALTTGSWTLTQGGNPASLEAGATLTNTNAAGAEIESELVCT